MTGKKQVELYSEREIIELFEKKGGGSMSFDQDYGSILFRALSQLPKEVVDWAVEKVVFISSLDFYRAYTLSLKELVKKNKTSLIMLCESLRHAPREEQAFDIAHEIAHAKLRHVTIFFDKKTMKESESKDEKEADDLARNWLGY